MEVTIRTGQQVLGAGDLLQQVLRKSQDYRLALHLGDAIDVSCSTEWYRFSRVMERDRGRPGPKSWLFAPGNHDGYLAGNFYPLKDGIYTDEYWNNICNVGRVIENDQHVHQRITKNQVLKEYLSQVLGSKIETDKGSRGRSCPTDGLCLSYSLSSEAWKSYLVQLVRLPGAPDAKRPVYALLLDTSDYKIRPYIPANMPKAGLVAGISDEQLESASDLVRGLPDEALFFIAGHHPLNTWGLEPSPLAPDSAWKALLSHPGFLNFFVTAHTHEGGWYTHEYVGTTLNELNLGSLTDAPLHFRSLIFQENSEGAIRVNSRRILLAEEESPDCSGFRAMAGSGYAVSEQLSQAQRWSDYPKFLSTALSAFTATRYSLALWHAKHEELRPQLRFYADLVNSTMPPQQSISYQRFDTPMSTRVLKGRQQIVERLNYLAQCSDGKACSVQEKGHLMLALDDYYWDESTPEPVREAAHLQRYCVALNSAEEAGARQQAVAKALDGSVHQFRTLRFNSRPPRDD
ncbi:hypothetical protein [Achromobacter spanius]|uniref:hypothetical protein n=1 Tax=Achromobacter spanius TaxID=217203 RepID=UPI0037F481CD